MKFLVICLPLAYLWYWVFDSVRAEWSTNPQYSYGWVVPILCIGLIFRNWKSQSTPHPIPSIQQQPRNFQFAAFTLLLFLFLPARLIVASTPEWRPLQWLLAIIAVGATLYIFHQIWGKEEFAKSAFPISFFLVAIPWPSPIEHFAIQHLTSLDASVVVELMGVLGIPAIQHGNVIEVSSGVVGIDEACSGIRSFQSSLMISLFLGEFYRLSWKKRTLLLGAGIVLSFAFNVCRTSFLTWIAAKKGVGAIASYHDPAGLAILVTCTISLWLVGLYLAREKVAVEPSTASKDFVADSPNAPSNQSSASQSAGFKTQPSRFCFRLSIAMIAWLCFVEVGTQFWFAYRESKLVIGPEWTVTFPEKSPAFKINKMADKTYDLLRFDQGKEAEWQDGIGAHWYAYYFNWFPGRVAGYLAKRHTPEICMGASGQVLKAGPDLFVANVHGINLPIRQYLYQNQGITMHVFHSRWEAGANQSSAVQWEASRLNLVRSIWAGRGKHGQKVIEVIITGYESPEKARAALVQQLETMVHVQPTKAVAKN